MTIYETELQELRMDDEIQNTSKNVEYEYDFIHTAGHGYLVVERSDKYAYVARGIVNYGYKGRYAYYLEEDCEAGEFLKTVVALKKAGG